MFKSMQYGYGYAAWAGTCSMDIVMQPGHQHGKAHAACPYPGPGCISMNRLHVRVDNDNHFASFFAKKDSKR